MKIHFFNFILDSDELNFNQKLKIAFALLLLLSIIIIFLPFFILNFCFLFIKYIFTIGNIFFKILLITICCYYLSKNIKIIF